MAFTIAMMYLFAGLLSCTLFRSNYYSVSPGQKGATIWIANRSFEFAFWFARVVIWTKENIQAEKAMKQLRQTMPELLKLKDELTQVKTIPEPLEALVSFFNVVSDWHDCKKINDLRWAFNFTRIGIRYQEIATDLYALQCAIESGGRNMQGENRTQLAEAVTPEKVFLGNVYGINTHNVSFWLARKDEPKGGWEKTHFDTEHTRSRNSYDVVADQARDIMNPLAKSMIEVIDRLDQVA